MKRLDITYQDKINELRLDITHPKSANTVFVLVEGDSDIRLFRKFFNLSICKVENIPGGKSGVEQSVIELLSLHNLVIGIRDADFIHLSPNPQFGTNIYATDYHDIEITLICTQTIMNSMICEHLDITKHSYQQVMNDILITLEMISYLKWLNEIKSLEIKFECGFQDLISFNTTSLDFPQYFSRVLVKSPNAKIKDINTITNEINILKSKNPNLLQLTNGHDFIETFSKYARDFGKSKSISNESIASSFRIAFTIEHYRTTALYINTENWGQRNNCPIY